MIFSIPFIIGYIVGSIFDVFSFVFRKKFQISSIRIKKFCATTLFTMKKQKYPNFERPYSLEEAIKMTLNYEFIENNYNNEVFYTE